MGDCRYIRVESVYVWVTAGTYGSSVGSLFNFARWIFFLNVILLTVWLLFVIIPQAISFDYGTVNASFSVLDLIDATVRANDTLTLNFKVTVSKMRL